MRIQNPCEWMIDRIKIGRPFFSVRINDGEMTQMYRSKPEGELLGTSENPAYCHWKLGTALNGVMQAALMTNNRQNVLLGHCYWDDSHNELNKVFWENLGPWIADGPEAGGHWPLEGACDGSTRRLIEAAREAGPTCLVTSEKLAAAGKLFNGGAFMVEGADSWRHRHEVHRSLALLAVSGYTLFWAAGAGLKPTAWRLWREHPQSTHIDVGHVFNGALGLRDYGWLQRRDGWWDHYFAPGGFAEWVKEKTR